MDASWRRELVEEVGEAAAQVLAASDALVASFPDPPRSLGDLQRFIGIHEDAAQACRDLLQVPRALELLLRLGAVSRYGLETALRRPQDFWAIVGGAQQGQVWGRRTLVDHLAGELSQDGAVAGQVLAAFKHRQFLRIMLGDLSGALGFEAVVSELSDVTDALAQAAFELALAGIAPRFGLLPRPPQLRDQASGFYRAHADPSQPLPSGFTVLAMGKLGGRELNYSSDIDLIFVYHVAPGAEGERDWHEAFTALGRAVIGLLERPDGQSTSYRVDMRLRPEGERGELALSLRETVDYYYSVGRPWERQALIKVRPIAGDLALGQRLLDELRPWVYPQDPDWATLDEARSMRRRIEERARERDVKTGAGGIRDIEFLVQFFQLCFGGRQPELRLRATLPMLRLLADRRILPREHARELESAYILLRCVEHRLQLYEDRQEHELPLDAAARARLAWSLDEMDPGHFAIRLAAVRARVRELVGQHFLEAGKEQDAALALVVQGEADTRLAQRVLGSYGFKDVPRAAAGLKALATEPFFVLSRHRTERALVALLPDMLACVAQAPQPDQALANLGRMVAAVGGRATFFDMLAARRDILALITGFAGWANYLVDLFARFPGLTDELLDALSTRPRSASLLTLDARALVQGISQLAEPLSFMQARETAVTALRDLDGLGPQEVGTRLAAIAEAIIATVLARVVMDQVRVWGAPVERGRPTGFAVLGLGKLGGQEMTYASDVDVIFACDPGGRCAKSDQDGAAFWLRVAQTLMRTLGEGRLYEIDTRLRPWGEQGQLVVSTRTLADYWAEPRDLWERMAMLRVGLLAGDPRLGTESLAIIRSAAFGRALPADAAAQVVDMRRRLEASVAGKDHLKRGPGGYVDHEFIAQFFSLGQDAGAVLARTHSPGTAGILTGLAELGRIPGEAVEELLPGLAYLRRVEARMRLSAGRAVSAIPVEREERTALARRCGCADLAAFDRELQAARTTARRWFERLIGKV